MHSARPGIPSGHGGRLCGPVVDTRQFFFQKLPDSKFSNSEPLEFQADAGGSLSGCGADTRRFSFHKLPDSKFCNSDPLEFQADAGGSLSGCGVNTRRVGSALFTRSRRSQPLTTDAG